MLSFCILALLQQSPPAEWVTSDVWAPKQGQRAMVIFPIGDLDGDSAQDAVWSIEDSYRGWSIVRVRNGAGRELDRAFPIGEAFVDRLCVTASPVGGLLSGIGAWNGYKLTSVRLDSVGLPPFAVAHTSRSPRYTTRAGDLDGDGWEDLFFLETDYNYSAWAGALDGGDLSVLWLRSIQGEFFPRPLYPILTGEHPDIDGDGVPDLIAVWDEAHPVPGVGGGHRVDIFSGANGGSIWSISELVGETVSSGVAEVPDVNGDSLCEVLFSDREAVVLHSGADGASIWAFDPLVAFGQAPPLGYAFAEPLPDPLFTSTPEGRQDIVIPGKDVTITGPPHAKYALGHFDPETGAFLGRAALPEDLAPWFPDTLQVVNRNMVFALGDEDRDGLAEYCFETPAPSIAGDMGDYHFVTLSMKTLTVPDQVSVGLGNGFDAEVRIPSGANRPCYLVMSRGFDRDGGLRLEGWKTHLAPDAWLDRSVATRSLQVTLDAQGHGTIHVPIPPDPNLVGATVYTKAVVLESAAPDAEVWTLSTLGITELVL